MRPILCVIDLSEMSTQVIEVAARMAYAYKTVLTILYPYRLIQEGYHGEILKLKLKLEQEAKEKFAALTKRIPLLSNVVYDFQPEIGFPYDRINAYVKRNKVEAVIISQRQANTINEINPSALQTLITSSKLPFTIVPEEIDAEVFLR